MTLKDVPSNPSEAQVDDVTLVKGVPVDLDEEQAARLVATTGVKLDTGDTSGSKSKDDLQAEADIRGLTVEGTGSGGNVTKDDLVAALQAHDEQGGGS